MAKPKSLIVFALTVFSVSISNDILSGQQFRDPPAANLNSDGRDVRENGGRNSASDASRSRMVPISFARQDRDTSNNRNPAPSGTPINPLDSAIMQGAQQQGLSDQLTEQPRLRALIEGESEFPIERSRSIEGVEVIKQRYPDGKLQILREVKQNEDGDYYNHGQWQLFNRQGQVLAEGQFYNGLMDGFWRRWHPDSAEGIFATVPYNQFKGPFLSTASFTKGKLDGLWTMSDRYQRKIFEIPFQDGKRNGTASWWLPNSVRMREITFYNDLIDGSLKEWNSQNKLVLHDEFISGKKIVRETSYYLAKRKESENFYLDGRLELNGEDEWWTASPAEYQPVGERIQHGPAIAWHDNEQIKMKGRYENGTRVGRFTWWHFNGQKQLEGTYEEGAKVGDWIWWHENGFKAIQGSYTNDRPSGVWVWWHDDGSVETRKDLSQGPGAEYRSNPSIEPPGSQVPSFSTLENLPSPLKKDEDESESEEGEPSMDGGPDKPIEDTDVGDNDFDLGQLGEIPQSTDPKDD